MFKVEVSNWDEQKIQSEIVETCCDKILQMKDQIKREVVNKIVFELRTEIMNDSVIDNRINEILDKADKVILSRINNQFNERSSNETQSNS